MCKAFEISFEGGVLNAVEGKSKSWAEIEEFAAGLSEGDLESFWARDAKFEPVWKRRDSKYRKEVEKEVNDFVQNMRSYQRDVPLVSDPSLVDGEHGTCGLRREKSEGLRMNLPKTVGRNLRTNSRRT